jgi:hypothetical protein
VNTPDVTGAIGFSGPRGWFLQKIQLNQFLNIPEMAGLLDYPAIQAGSCLSGRYF